MYVRMYVRGDDTQCTHTHASVQYHRCMYVCGSTVHHHGNCGPQVVPKFQLVVDMVIADKSELTSIFFQGFPTNLLTYRHYDVFVPDKQYVLQHKHALDDVVHGLVLSDDNPRRGQAGISIYIRI